MNEMNMAISNLRATRMVHNRDAVFELKRMRRRIFSQEHIVVDSDPRHEDSS